MLLSQVCITETERLTNTYLIWQIFRSPLQAQLCSRRTQNVSLFGFLNHLNVYAQKGGAVSC